MPAFKTRIVSLLFICSLFMISFLLYFMVIFDEKKVFENVTKKTSKPVVIVGFSEVDLKNESLREQYERLIKIKLSLLNDSLTADTSNFAKVEKNIALLKQDLVVHDNKFPNLNKLWLIPKRWVRARQVIPQKAPELGNILNALQTAKIVKSDVAKKGTQLKLLLTLEGGQLVLFKPRRYAREYIADGIYAGADRHNGEIIAFHLSRILDLRYTPITASRIVNVVEEIKSVATSTLLKTFVTNKKDNGTLECFYGECYYCSEYDQVCPTQDGRLEGAVVLMLPMQYQLQKLRHPWQRTYKNNQKAQWENDVNYCLSLIKLKGDQQRLLDLVDTAIFDYLIGNADRHHFEVFKDVENSALLLIDNGKSFGNASHDEITILFPLLQCCILRSSTYHQLRLLSSHKLFDILRDLLSDDLIWPLLTEDHLRALDRRLLSILASIEICFDTNNKQNVLIN